MSYSRTQHSDSAGAETQTSNSSIPSLTLCHWALLFWKELKAKHHSFKGPLLFQCLYPEENNQLNIFVNVQAYKNTGQAVEPIPKDADQSVLLINGPVQEMKSYHISLRCKVIL